MVVAVVWLGSSFNTNQDTNLLKLNVKNQIEKETIRQILYPRFELTSEGEPICINDYASRITRD